MSGLISESVDDRVQDTSMELWVRWHRDQRLLEVMGLRRQSIGWVTVLQGC